MNYAIPYLPIEQLNALQNAIAAGALSQQIRSLQLAIEANKGHSSIQDTYLRDLEALQAAGRAVMSACPVEQTAGSKAVHGARNLFATHHIIGYNSKEFQDAYIHLAKEVGYNWEHLQSDLPPVTSDKKR